MMTPDTKDEEGMGGSRISFFANKFQALKYQVETTKTVNNQQIQLRIKPNTASKLTLKSA